MLRFAAWSAMLLALVASACGLEELVAGHGQGGIAATGGAGGSGGAGGVGGGGASCGDPQVIFERRASFTTQSTEAEQVLSVVLPANVAEDGWVVFASARLASQTAQERANELRYLVEGVERGVGQSRTQNDAPGGGPWLVFDWLAPSDAAREISIEFRSLEGAFLATAEDVHLVAFPAPVGAEPIFFHEPDVQTLTQPEPSNRIYQTVASLDIPVGAPGDWLVMLGLAANESPGEASVGVRAVAPGADLWPVASSVLPRPHLANPGDEWQSYMLLRSIASDGSALRVDLQVDASSPSPNGDGSRVRHLRGLALRREAFGAVHFASVPEEQEITALDEIEVAQLDLPAASPCHERVAAQLSSVQALGHRRVRFSGIDVSFAHQLASNESKLVYGSFAALDPGARTLATFVSAADAETASHARESILLALDIMPSTSR